MFAMLDWHKGKEMNIKTIKIFLTTSLCLGMAATANALSYSYDFGLEKYVNTARGTDSLKLDHATLTGETANLIYTQRYGGGIYDNIGGDGDITIEFSKAFNFLTITAGDGGGDIDAFAVTLYEFGTGKELGAWKTPIFDGLYGEKWFTLDIKQQNIGKAVFDPANSGILPGKVGGLRGIAMTELSYGILPIPEPGTGLLLSIGLAWLLWTRKRS